MSDLELSTGTLFETWYRMNFKNSVIPKEVARIYWDCYSDSEIKVIDYSDGSAKIEIGESF